MYSILNMSYWARWFSWILHTSNQFCIINLYTPKQLMKIGCSNQNPVWRNNDIYTLFIYRLIHCSDTFSGLYSLDCFKAHDANCLWVRPVVMWNRLTIHQSMARFIVRSHDVSKPWDFICCHGCVSEIWQAQQPIRLSNSGAIGQLHLFRDFKARYGENGTFSSLSHPCTNEEYTFISFEHP